MRRATGTLLLGAALLIGLQLPSCAQVLNDEGSQATQSRADGVPPIPPRKPPVPVEASSVQGASQGNMICKDPRLTGKPVDNVVGRIPGCGIYAPVKLTAISGIKLTTPATLDCPTARTVANWLTGVADVEARRVLGARITKVWVMGSYSCRTRNNRPRSAAWSGC